MPYAFNPFTGNFDFYLTGTGAEGPAGKDGSTVRNGTGAPGAGLGNNGDFYIDTATYEIYGPKSAGAWGSGTKLKGPEGPEGKEGKEGKTGANGTNGTNGTNGLTSPNNRSFAVNGTIAVESYPGFMVRIEEGEEYEIIGMDLFLPEGTEVEVTLRKNGVSLGASYEKVVVKKTEESGLRVSSAVVLKHADDKARFDLNVLAATGTPKDLYVTVYLKRIK